MRDEIEEFHQHAAQPFGINPAGIESHARYAERFRFGFPLLSDPDREVTAAFGALRPDGRRVHRSVVLVDRAGTVRFAVRGTPTTDEILASLAE